MAPTGRPEAKVLRLEITNTHVAAADMIRDAILDGRFAPGDRLKEIELAEMLGISRTPVREAFLVLAAQGLLILNKGRGVTVRSYTPEEMRRNYEMRARLEAYAARLAAGGMSEELLAEARDSIERMRALQPSDVPGLVAENTRFHNLILEAADDERLRFMVTGLLELPFTYKNLYWSQETKGSTVSADFHERVLTAIAAGDADEAEKAMYQHITNAGVILVGGYAADHPA
jgi:DNA-binding GntR family transcriptional regulator